MEQNDMSLPFTMKTPKSQLITEQQPTRKKKKRKKLKRYLTPKDKEKATMRQRESSEPQIILPSLKIWQWKEEPPENLALKGSRIWSQEFHRTRGNRNFILGGNILSLIHISTLGKKQWSHKRLGQTYLASIEGLLQRWEVSVAHCGNQDIGSDSSGEYALAWTHLEATIFFQRLSPTQQPIGSSAGTPEAK